MQQCSLSPLPLSQQLAFAVRALSALSTAMSTSTSLPGVAAGAAALMPVLKVAMSKLTYPTGNKSFSVMQAFPAGLTESEADPYLMLDHFGPTKSKGVAAHADAFEVPWHPHRGQDIATYMLSGVGRHADSLGNRETYATPGLQFCSVGSGIEHAEGGGTPAGESTEGFQLWVNVPSSRKMDAPRYGTVGPDRLPLLDVSSTGATARLVSGDLDGARGPFETVQPLLIVDVTLPPGADASLSIAAHLDNAMVYARAGSVTVNDRKIATHGIVLLDAKNADGARGINIVAEGGAGAGVLVLCGKRLNQPIAWHGPFVMTTDAEIRETISELQNGAFPPVRAPWDYKKIASFPADHPAVARSTK